MNTTFPHLPASDGLVRLHGETPVTTSPIIAETFGKRHKHVLDATRELLKELEEHGDTGRPNFRPTTYRDSQGKRHPAYEVTRDGFTLLAMGFTGREALRFKLRFIEAFNLLERRVQVLHARETAALRRALLEREPRWSAIARYQAMGLKQVEIAKLMDISRETVRKERYEMQALGLLPAQEATPQLSLLAGGEA